MSKNRNSAVTQTVPHLTMLPTLNIKSNDISVTPHLQSSSNTYVRGEAPFSDQSIYIPFYPSNQQSIFKKCRATNTNPVPRTSFHDRRSRELLLVGKNFPEQSSSSYLLSDSDSVSPLKLDNTSPKILHSPGKTNVLTSSLPILSARQILRKRVLGSGTYGIVFDGEFSTNHTMESSSRLSPLEMISAPVTTSSPSPFSISPTSHSTSTSAAIAHSTVANSNSIALKINQICDKVDFIGTVRELDVLSKIGPPHPNILALKGLLLASPISGGRSVHDTQTPTNSPDRNSSSMPVPTKRPRAGHKWDSLYYIYERGEIDAITLIQERELSCKERVRSIAQILTGVEYLHSKGIIHRDLAPSNILWCPTPGSKSSGQLKICDFGLSKTLNPATSSTPRVVSAWYRAPEICYRWQVYDFAVDRWSVGCICYEFMALKPFIHTVGDDDLKILNYILARHPIPPTDREIQTLSRYSPLPLSPDVKRHRRGISELMNLTDEIRGELGSEGRHALYDLIIGLLRLVPSERASLTKTLNSPLFDRFPSIRAEIDETRKHHQPIPHEEEEIPIWSSNSRNDLIRTVYGLMTKGKHMEWYTHAVPFECLRIHDVWFDDRKRKSKYIPEDTEQRLLEHVTLIYLVLKAVKGLCFDEPFDQISNLTTPQHREKCESLERELLEILNYRIISATPYDIFIEAAQTIELYLFEPYLREANVKVSSQDGIYIYQSPIPGLDARTLVLEKIIHDLFVYTASLVSSVFRKSYINYVSMTASEIVISFIRRRLPQAAPSLERYIRSRFPEKQPSGEGDNRCLSYS